LKPHLLVHPHKTASFSQAILQLTHLDQERTLGLVILLPERTPLSMVDLIFGSEAHPLQLLPITQQLTVGGIIAIPELAHFPKNLLLSLPDFVILLKPHSRFQTQLTFR
jgi:hypothetical protein